MKAASVINDRHSEKKLQNLKATIKSLNFISENFYMSAIVWLNSSKTEKYSHFKVLINSESCLNLISEKIVNQMRLHIISNTSTQIKVTNKQWMQLSDYTHINVTVRECTKQIQVSIVLENTSYILLLRQSWLWAVNAIVYYKQNKYWIQNNNSIECTLKLFKTVTLSSETSLKVWFSKKVNYMNLLYESYTLTSIALSEREQIDNILQQIKKKMKQQKNENKKYYNKIKKYKKNSEEEKFLKVSHL